MSAYPYPPSANQTPPPELANSAASSSQLAAPSRADQISHRLYLKTVAVLVDARLTHYGANKAERKRDKWFNVGVHECDLHRADLQIYRALSSYAPASGAPIPPLLIAFILDTSDIPAGQTLTWTSGGRRVRLDPAALRRGSGGGGQHGIVLERWTFSASETAAASQTASLAIHSAYRLGIVHVRALYAVVRLLPAYRLFRRLRRSGSGLRVGIKLWGPDGFPPSPRGLEEAWQVMERDLVGLDTALDQLVPGSAAPSAAAPAPGGPGGNKQYALPAADLFGYRFETAVTYRPEVEFHLEAIEAVLSEKFVDMDEDWFTPTVARHRLAAESQAQAQAQDTCHAEGAGQAAARTASVAGQETAQGRAIVTASSSGRPKAAQSTSATAVPFPSPIPNRQQGAPVGSFGSSLNRPVGSRATSGVERGSLGAGKWGAFAEGLPFATGVAGSSTSASREPSSPGPASSGASATARRLSSQSLQPFKPISASPSASMLRGHGLGGTPVNAPGPAYGRPPDRPSSIGRTSSFLSQSGRSFTHAQMANMIAASGGASSSSPPVGSLRRDSPTPASPISPSSLTFSKQHLPRSLSGRPHMAPAAGSSPFVPSSYDRDSTGLPSPGLSTGGAGAGGPQAKRYSISLSRRPTGGFPGSASPTHPPPLVSHSGSSADASLATPSGYGQGLLRRTSTRESGLRHSVEQAAEREDIEDFLRQLDTLVPPSQPYAARASSSASSPLGTSRRAEPAPVSAGSPSSTGPGAQSHPSLPGMTASAAHRAPLTRTKMDDLLRRMAGSFSAESSTALDPPTRAATRPPSASTGAADSGPGSYGLLSASRPGSAAPTMSPAPAALPPTRGLPGQTQSPAPPSLAPPVVPDSTTLDAPEAGAAAAPAPPPMQRTLSAGLRHSASGGALGLAGRPLPDAHAPTRLDAAPASPTATARSLPGKPSPQLAGARSGRMLGLGHGDAPPVPAEAAAALSPQTTGGASDPREVRRRGPVLVRGGFGVPAGGGSSGGAFGSSLAGHAFAGGFGGGPAGAPSVAAAVSSRASASSSPSHSPIRDYARGGPRSARLDRLPGSAGPGGGPAGLAAVSLGQAGQAAAAADDDALWRRKGSTGLRGATSVSAVGLPGPGAHVPGGASGAGGVGSPGPAARKAVSRGASPEGRAARSRVASEGDGVGAFRRLGLGPAERD